MFWAIIFIMHKLKFLWTKFQIYQRHHFRIEVRQFRTPLSNQHKKTTHPVMVDIQSHNHSRLFVGKSSSCITL